MFDELLHMHGMRLVIAVQAFRGRACERINLLVHTSFVANKVGQSLARGAWEALALQELQGAALGMACWLLPFRACPR